MALKLAYDRTSEIPSALARLSPQELSELVEKRLLGFSAGLPLPNRDEDPKDILEYAFRKAEGSFREQFRLALRGVVDRLAAEVLSHGAAVLSDRTALLEGVCSLLAYTSCSEAWDSLSLLYNRLDENIPREVRAVILACLAGLVRPPDSGALDVFGPMVAKFETMLTDFDLCGLAFQALFRYDWHRAARAVPRLAATLASKSEEQAARSLVRILSPMIALLEATDQISFLQEATPKAEGGEPHEVIDCVVEGFLELWGLAPEARQHVELLSVSARFTAELQQMAAATQLIASRSTKFGLTIWDDLGAHRVGQGFVRLDRTEEILKKRFKEKLPDLGSADNLVEVAPDVSTQYSIDIYYEGLKPQRHFIVRRSSKSPNVYSGAPYRTLEARESSIFIQIAPEQEQRLFDSGSSAYIGPMPKPDNKLP